MNLQPLHPPSDRSRRRPLALPLAIGVAITASVVLSACGDRKPAPAATPAAAPAAPADPMVVKVKPEMASSFKVGTVTTADIASVQEIAGRIDANERLVARIGASVTGRVTDVLAEVGDRVRPGQPLARVTSPELTQAQLGYLRAHSATVQAERAVDRARQLIQADVIGSAELQRRESELNLARAELRAASDQLRLIGIGPEAIDRLREQGTLHPSTSVTATLSGVVIERKASPGQVAQPGDPLFTVADLSNVWVVGALPEQTARRVEVGQKVEVSVPALGERKFTGRVVFISDTVSPETRTLTVRTQVDNTDRQLKPQMLATLRLVGPAVTQPTVPAAAVVRENDRDHVYVRTAENTYRFTPVELGPTTADGQRPVIKGPATGTAVVVDGAFHLHNERKRAELQ